MSGASGTESADADSPDVTAQEAQLARRAAEGDGVAFATLYDRYEQSVFTFCQRITGSAEDAADATQEAFVAVLERLPKLTDRDLNFAAYLFTTARHASYRVIDKRRKAEPVDEIPDRGASGSGFGGGFEPDGDPDEDPERSALAGGQQEQIRAAHARLPERQREVLVLRELEELSYDEIAEIMDMNRNSVAQLISRARINLRDELRGEALASIAATSPDCEKALPLIAMREDGQLADPLDAAWLEQHLAGCERCRAAIESMHEAGISYRALAPAVAFVWLRNETIAKAAERMGFDWKDAPPRSSGDGSGGSGGGGAAAGGAGAAGASDGAGEAIADAGANGSDGVFTRARTFVHERRRRAAVLGGLLLLLLLGGATAIAVGGSDTPNAPATDQPAAGTSPVTEASGTGDDSSATGGGSSGKDKSKGSANTPIPGVGTTTTGGTPKKGKKAAQTTIAGVPVGHPRTHTPKRTHTPTKHPKHHTPKHTGGGSTPTPTPTPTPTNDNPSPTATQDNPPPATTNNTPPPTTTAIAGPPPSTTSTPTTPCRPSATGRPCP